MRYGAVHKWLARHCEKAGACEHCPHVGRTEWAFLRHGELHTRNRADYIELCHACHARFDARTTSEQNEVQNRYQAAKNAKAAKQTGGSASPASKLRIVQADPSDKSFLQQA